MYFVHEQIEAPAATPLNCPSCGLPAQIVDRFSLSGTTGLVEHVKIVCTAGHWFTPPVDSLPSGASREEGTGRQTPQLAALR